MEEEIYNKYRKLGRGSWGKDLSLWKTVYNAFLTLIKNEEEFNPVMEMFLNMFVRVPEARKEGRSVIMHPFNYEPALFFAMDIAPIMQETFSVSLAPLHINEPYIDLTNELGFGDTPTLCNAQRPIVGAYMKGVAPIPDMMFFTSTPCNALAMNYQVFQQLINVPFFNMDIPYWAYDQANEFYDEKIIDYMVKQNKELVSWLEKQTNQKLDEERFLQTMKLVNESREYIVEFNDLLKNVPCPVPSVTGFFNFSTMASSSGSIEAVKATKWIRDQAVENVKNGIAGVPDEKIRIAWPYTHVFFDAELLPWIEETFQAVVIMDILGYYPVLPHDVSTIEKCYESLAKGVLDFSMIGTCRGPAEYYVDFILNYVKEYKIDCVIVPCQFACKHTYSITRVAIEAVREQLGIPCLLFGVDPYDSREVTSEAIRRRISEFLTQVVL